MKPSYLEKIGRYFVAFKKFIQSYESSKWFRLYFIYALLILLSGCFIAACLVSNTHMLKSYNQSILEGKVLFSHINEYDTLVEAVSKVDEPANTIFISKNVLLEKKKLLENFEKFNALFNTIQDSCNKNFGCASTPVEFQTLFYLVNKMKQETLGELTLYEKKQFLAASQKMVWVDSLNASVLSHINNIKLKEKKAEEYYFSTQLQEAKKFSSLQYAILSLLAGMVFFVFIYSMRFFRMISDVEKFEKKQLQDLQNTLKELSDIQYALDYSTIVAITDIQGKIVYANKGFCDISKYAQEELIGQDHRIINSGHHSQAFFKLLWKTIAQGKIWKGEVKNKAKDGTFYWVDTTIIPQLDLSGKPHRYVAIRHDITLKKQMEEEILAEKKRAELASRSKSDFLATMSHEIRTPMNGILGMTAIALKTQLDQEQRKYLQIIQNSGQTLLELINDILDFSKIEAGKIEVDPVAFSVRQVVQDIIQVFEQKATEKGLRLNYSIAPNVPVYAKADVLRLKQILINLISNALKFTFEGSVSLDVRLLAQPDEEAGVASESEASGKPLMLVCSVTDTGIGMTDEQKEKVFKPFTQADNSTTRKFGGTGLGLSISLQLAQLMGGNIGFTTASGHGTTFNLQLPIEALEVLEEAASVETMSNSQSFQILLVEDNEVNQLVAETFLSDAGHLVTIASNGKEALLCLEKQAFDLVFMDLSMPEMDGFQATHEIRDREKQTGQHLPIVALTANALKTDLDRCMEIGMDGYISKPFKEPELLGVIQTLLEPKA